MQILDREHSILRFDFSAPSLGEIRGFKTRFHLHIAPHQAFFDASRKLILKGIDGVCFIADSQEERFDANIECLELLREALHEQGYELDSLPFVIQYNKRDLPNAMSVEELNRALNPTQVPYFESDAKTGRGVFDTLKCLTKNVLSVERGTWTPPTRQTGEAAAQGPGDTTASSPKETRGPQISSAPRTSRAAHAISGEIPATPTPAALQTSLAAPAASREDLASPPPLSRTTPIHDETPGTPTTAATTPEPPSPSSARSDAEAPPVEATLSPLPATTTSSEAGRRTPLEAMHVLLCRLYHESITELRRFVRHEVDGDKLLAEIPTAEAPLARQVDGLLVALEQRDLTSITLARLSDHHPRYRAEVERIAASYLTGALLDPSDMDIAASDDDDGSPGADEVSRLLADATARRERLRGAGRDVSAADREILDLRRRRRDGATLYPGDELHRGRYLLISQIGHGGFGAVWRAKDRTNAVDVAIKVLHKQHSEDRTRKERFFRGARRMAELEHGAIVQVLDVGRREAGHHYFVMELVEGGDLKEAVRSGRVTRDELVPILLRVGDALGHAHDRAFVHRDIKPENILLTAAGAPKLTDFDLVGAADTTGGTRTGALGTFLYAAPEQMNRPQDATARADVYGLGMTLMFGLAGHDLPADAVFETKAFIKRLACSEPLKAVVQRATAKKARRRHNSVKEFNAELLAAADNTPESFRALERALPWTDPAGRTRLVARMIEILDTLADDALLDLLGAGSLVGREAVQTWEHHASHANDSRRCARYAVRAARVLAYTFAEGRSAVELLASASFTLCTRFALTPSAEPIADVKLLRRSLLRERGDWAALAAELAHEAMSAADPATRIELRREAADLHVDKLGEFLPGIFLLAAVLDDLPATLLRSKIQELLTNRPPSPEVFALAGRAIEVAATARPGTDADPELAIDLWHACSVLEPAEELRCVAPPGVLPVARLALTIAYCGASMSETTSLRGLHRHAASLGMSPGPWTTSATEGSRTLFFDLESSDFTVRVNGAAPEQLDDASNELMLRNADAVVLVVDARAERQEANLAVVLQTREALRKLGRDPDRVPCIVQYDRQDEPRAPPVSDMRDRLGLHGFPGYQSYASTGEGVLTVFQSALLNAALHRKCMEK